MSSQTSTTSPACGRLTAPTALPLAKRQTCIAALADGWIGAPDLCPPCTQSFMTALDGIAGPLKWHHAYADRAAGAEVAS